MSLPERSNMADDTGTVVPFRGGVAIRDGQGVEDRKWLKGFQIALLAGVTDRAVRLAISSGEWRGCVLNIRQVVSSHGSTGRIPQVHVDSLPRDLREAWYLGQGIALHAPAVPSVKVIADTSEAPHDPAWQEAVNLARWKAQTIRAVLDAKPRSPERGAAISTLIAEPLHWPDGKVKAVTRQTVSNWVRDYEAGGLQALVRKKRKDLSASRTKITRAWDSFFDGANPKRRDDAANAIECYIRSLWAGGESGWRAVAEKSTTRLIELSKPLGCGFEALNRGRLTDNAAMRTQFGICKISRRRVEGSREYAKVALKSRDNATWVDKHQPRITRDYSSLAPRDIIVGDVHPVDIMMLRPDGSKVYPKAISWFDPATNEIWMTFAMLEKSEGVRREHVAQSFASMVDAWGLPKLLYLDNGSEYKWAEMIGGFTMLSQLAGSMSVFDLQSDRKVNEMVANRRESVLRSQAYNAPGKPGIEGAFGVIEQVQFSNIVGWTAGDRMNKRTHQKGRDPIPFPGTMDEFMVQVDRSLEWYHKRPQHGRLAGKSPNEALRGHIDNGWGKTVLARPEVMMLAFAYEAKRMPDRGRIRYASPRGSSITYYHDALLPYTGQPLLVKSPAGRDDVLFVFDGDKLLCMAKPERVYHPLDAEGAKEGNRRARVLNRIISERRKHCDRLSLIDETARHVEHFDDAPEAPVAMTVNHKQIEEMNRRLIAADDEALAAPKPRAFAKDQWGVSDNADVTFLEDEEDV